MWRHNDVSKIAVFSVRFIVFDTLKLILSCFFRQRCSNIPLWEFPSPKIRFYPNRKLVKKVKIEVFDLDIAFKLDLWVQITPLADFASKKHPTLNRKCTKKVETQIRASWQYIITRPVYNRHNIYIFIIMKSFDKVFFFSKRGATSQPLRFCDC